MSVARAKSALPGAEIIDPRAYATKGYPHAEWARLRREDPVHLRSRSEGKIAEETMQAARLEHVELAGPVSRLLSSVVGGSKQMPIGYRFAAASH